MKYEYLLALIAIFISVGIQSLAGAAESSQPPNVVLIFADDLGYGDLGCYGASKVKTPNIDRLAKGGRRFTDAHSASAVCTPSRYALLTGEYPLRANGGAGVWGPAAITSGLIIDPDQLTIADVFKSQGYATAALGKWHLGFGEGKNDWQEPLRPGPQDLGFDYYFGLPVVNSAPPYVYVENDRIVGSDPNDPLVYLGRGRQKQAIPITPIPPEASQRTPNFFKGAVEAHKKYNDYTVGTVLAEKAVDWINANQQNPFFLYLATTHIHHPFTPGERFQGTSQAELYGDFIQELDWMVGEVIQSLEDNGLSENTLVIFTSDNGGMLNLGGRNAVSAGHRINGDLLGFKFGAWEGGHRVPFLAKWPSKIKPGTLSGQLLCNVDMLATCMALLGQDSSKLENDSVNVLPALIGEPKSPLREQLILAPHKPTHLALRNGKWLFIGARGSGGFRGSKPHQHAWGGPPAVEFVGGVNSDIEKGKIKKDAPPAQLYDLEADVEQTNNLYRQHPEVVQDMEALLDSCRKKGSEQSGTDAKRVPPKSSRSQQAVTAPDKNRPAAEAAKPNFVVIFADDLGYGDLSCYDPHGVETPYIDSMAADGFRSLDFFVPANVCSPSRAALLTGRYPMRCGIPVARYEKPGSKYENYGLVPDEITIPELLRTVGYRSLMAGKWHLGMEVEGSHPLDAGFDEYLGIPSNYAKNSVTRGPNADTLYRGKQIEQRHVECEELTKRYTDEVVSFIDRQQDEPFFIYVSHHIVHSPQLPSEDFRGTSKKGKYGDFIRELDHSTGRIMKALRDAGVDDKTLVVFTSDNGPTFHGSSGPLLGGKYCTVEGGHRVPGIFRWPGKIPAGQVSNITLTSMDLLPLFCELAGVALPQDRKIDGKHIWPILQGEAAESPHKRLYYYNGTNLQAVREGNWKLHLPRTEKDQPFWNKKKHRARVFVTLEKPHLYNLKEDVGEKNDLAEQYPEVVTRLLRIADDVRAELGDVRTTGSDQRSINLVDPQKR